MWQDLIGASEASGIAGWRKGWWLEAGIANPILDPLILETP